MQNLVHTDTFTHRRFYRQTTLQRSAQNFYIEQLLRSEACTHREAFMHRFFLYAETFTHRNLYAQKLLHTEASTQKNLFTEELLHIPHPNWFRSRGMFSNVEPLTFCQKTYGDQGGVNPSK